MAYIDQDRKRTVAAALKAIIPAGWKYSLSIHHHSTLTLTISAAPADIIGSWKGTRSSAVERKYFDLNTYSLADAFDDAELTRLFLAIHDAMDKGNHNRSDSSTDYFDVGWYTSIKIGRWDRPFICTAQASPRLDGANAAG